MLERIARRMAGAAGALFRRVPPAAPLVPERGEGAADGDGPHDAR